jgi:hypothetical protein
MNLKPMYTHHYPPFTNGRYFEEYFSDFWNKSPKDDFVFIDIYWCAVFHAAGNPSLVVPALRGHVFEKCKEAWRSGKIPFTVCQWDDGIMFDKPPNLVVFSMGQSKDVPLPLISEDITHRLEKTPRLSYEDRTTLCSFVGSDTFHVRQKMKEALDGRENVVIRMKTWDYKIDTPDADLFVTTTQCSKFGLAPRGYGPSSFRFFEIIKLGVIPVYIHDGDDARPFRDIIDYDAFSVSIHYNELESLYDRLNRVSKDEYMKMLTELEKVQMRFTMEGTCEYILKCLCTMRQSS